MYVYTYIPQAFLLLRGGCRQGLSSNGVCVRASTCRRERLRRIVSRRKASSIMALGNMALGSMASSSMMLSPAFSFELSSPIRRGLVRRHPPPLSSERTHCWHMSACLHSSLPQRDAPVRQARSE